MMDAVNRTTVERLKSCARVLREHHPSGIPDVDFITFGLATEYLRAFVGNEWTNQMVFGQHPTVSRDYRPGRGFMRAEATENAEEAYRNQERTLRLAELLFNLQEIEGIDTRLEDLRLGRIESTYLELEAGAFLKQRGVQFRYVIPSGIKGSDYDAEIPLASGIKVNCEMKCKAEQTQLGDGAVRNPLEAARSQLPSGEPGLVFFKVPEAWVFQAEAAAVFPKIIDSFLRNTSRVTAVLVAWEEQHLQPGDGALILYKFRIERGTPPKKVNSAVDQLLSSLNGPSTDQWTSFRLIAHNAMREEKNAV
jgi:hypothetical protein